MDWCFPADHAIGTERGMHVVWAQECAARNEEECSILKWALQRGSIPAPCPDISCPPPSLLAFMVLQLLGAEIVVVFEGSTELGDMFMVRQSYLASQIHWGHTFCTIVSQAAEGSTRHTVDLSRCMGGVTLIVEQDLVVRIMLETA